MDLPGVSTLIGGMWIVNRNYWGCNQYITQRALGADLPTARKGLLFAAFLKLVMPMIVVMPGIAAFALDRAGVLGDAMRVGGELNPDRAYPTLLAMLFRYIAPAEQGLAYGIVFAAGSLGSLLLSPVITLRTQRPVQTLRVPIFLALLLTAVTLVLGLVTP